MSSGAGGVAEDPNVSSYDTAIVTSVTVDPNAPPPTQLLPSASANSANEVMLKVAMIGDTEIGKTSLMVRYVNGLYDDMIPTMGINFMEKKITLRNNRIIFSIWDLGGQKDFVSMLPIVCQEAVAILFMFDLTRRTTLTNIREWYRQARGFNKTAVPILVGTKFDAFLKIDPEEQLNVNKQAKMYAHAMKCPLIYSSSLQGVNVQNLFKIILSKVFALGCTIPQSEENGTAILIY
ncbi:small monomeric GTPase [Pelomyxa schiedti]|nr:small monomeric GTPase [Pelomyxa schiedti]